MVCRGGYGARRALSTRAGAVRLSTVRGPIPIARRADQKPPFWGAMALARNLLSASLLSASQFDRKLPKQRRPSAVIAGSHPPGGGYPLNDQIDELARDLERRPRDLWR